MLLEIVIWNCRYIHDSELLLDILLINEFGNIIMTLRST